MSSSMTEQADPSANLLQWPKNDRRRFLHAVIKVCNLDQAIRFYTEGLGMKLLRTRDFPEEKYTHAFVGFGTEESNFALQLIYDYGAEGYDIQNGFGHFAIATQDFSKLLENVVAKGGVVIREPDTLLGDKSLVVFFKDPETLTFKLIQTDSIREPFCNVMLRVANLNRSITFYEKALGMKVLRKIENRRLKYDTVMLGYGDEDETTVLELHYLYGVTEYYQGKRYVQLALSTEDVFKSAEVVSLVVQDLGGKVVQEPGPIPGLDTKVTCFEDPDGWKIVLVDNEDFLKELQIKGVEKLSLS
ncbi:lactoylglutathione lyase [Ranunculus cassubicifolius]